MGAMLNIPDNRQIGTRWRILLLALLTFGILLLAQAAADARSVALIIGNSKYNKIAELANPTNDAQDLSASLTNIGYEVQTVIDADYETMRKALNKFSESANGAKVAMIFFAGHGIEIDKQNYLIPVDAKLETDTQVAFQTIPLDMMLNAVSGASKLRMVLLDACRNNPFVSKMRSVGAKKRSLGRGLAAVEPQTGTLVGFAAKEGTTASDGNGRNSPYTSALLKHIAKPDLDVGRLFRKVRDEVLETTGLQQEPFQYGSLPGEDVFMHPLGGTKKPGSTGLTQQAVIKPSTQPVIPPALPTPQDTEAKQAWDAISSSQRVSDYEIYLQFYSDSLYAKFAKARLEALKKQATPRETVQPAQPKPKPKVVQPAVSQPTRPTRVRTGRICRLNRSGDNFLSMRTCASTRCREIRRLGPGIRIALRARRGAWWKIQLRSSNNDRNYLGSVGYAYGKYICR